jgi:hypothetical protein
MECPNWDYCMSVKRHFTEGEDNILLDNYVKHSGNPKALAKLLANRKASAVAQHMKQAGFRQKMERRGTQ